MSCPTRIIASFLAFAVLAGPSAAQTKHKGLPILRGSVQDTTGKPLDGALVEIAGLKLRMFTSEKGTFRFENIKPGKYWVVARRIGYAPIQAALTFRMDEDREVEFQLDPLPHVLPEEIVRGDPKAWEARYQDFVMRSHGAFGYFLTRDDIERVRPHYLGDVVRRHLPFTSSEAYFTPAFSDFSRTFSGLGGNPLRRSRAASANCAPLVSVNGATPSGIWAVNDFRPEDVEALEVYRGNRMLPAIFSTWGTECGLVVVWTKG